MPSRTKPSPPPSKPPLSTSPLSSPPSTTPATTAAVDATVHPVIDAAAVDAAAARLEGVVTRTPLERNERLSDRTGAEVWLKREDLQVVRSYKLRGAYNLMAQLDPAARAAGVVCASAGNHGQGLAYACRLLDLHGVVFLPRTTPRQKRDRIAHLGGGAVELVVVGDTYDEAAAAAYEHAATTGATLVPAFDDPRTIAGQGTVVAEVIAQLGGPPDVLVVPVGGGGLLAGSLAWLRERHPSVRGGRGRAGRRGQHGGGGHRGPAAGAGGHRHLRRRRGRPVRGRR